MMEAGGMGEKLVEEMGARGRGDAWLEMWMCPMSSTEAGDGGNGNGGAAENRSIS